jgi:uncharacterized membrane protein HdeD (DUF308 family)
MLFNSLDKLKRTMVMLITSLMFIGLIMFAVPLSYVPIMGQGLGFAFIVFAILNIAKFIDSNKALIHYIRLLIGLIVGLVGTLLFAFDGLFLSLLNWLVGFLPILLGAMGLYHALTYARRSGRKGWGVPVFLNCLLLLFGTILFWNPWKDDPQKVLYVIGGTLFYSAVVYLISLFWIWPVQRTDGSDDV